jgi:hypothetical protein
MEKNWWAWQARSSVNKGGGKSNYKKATGMRMRLKPNSKTAPMRRTTMTSIFPQNLLDRFTRVETNLDDILTI